MIRQALAKFFVFLFLLIWSWLNVSELYFQFAKPFSTVSSSQISTVVTGNFHCHIDKDKSNSFSFISEVFSEEIFEEVFEEKVLVVLQFLTIYHKFSLAGLTLSDQIHFEQIFCSYKAIQQPPFYLLYHSFKNFLL
jgi:hypothetical protein